MKVLFAASEVVGFAKTGGLADVCGALPLALEDLGHQVVIVLPKYKCVQDKKIKMFKSGKDLSYALIGKNIRVYFIDNNAYFNRPGLYGDKTKDYTDNLERFSFYCRKSLELLKEINFKAEIIHIHDWQASLIPVYLKNIFNKDPFYADMCTVLTIHNLGYQGIFVKDEFEKLGLDWEIFNPDQLEFYGKINLLKGGIVYADIVNTVSVTYSKEILEPELGFGLEGVLREKKDKLYGVLNGLDYSIWDPNTDKNICCNFSAKSSTDKTYDKEDLQKLSGLPVKADIPLIGMVSRIAEHKGFDILTLGLDEICAQKVQLVILGTGDLKYHRALEIAAAKYPKKISLTLDFNDVLAHKIYAGADIFLMPSAYEPCGLGQLIALRYGTIPLVFKTGGLADTINPSNGFVFSQYNKGALVSTIKKALAVFSSRKQSAALIQKAMRCNFSWEASAKKYSQLYVKAKAG
ncbi:MAG: glycogen synthase [Candidatus Omnitrophica bacterium]|jgi:starch synthase|nr:glycogen synthase [Candidatus Omnitrophota bacterium]